MSWIRRLFERLYAPEREQLRSEDPSLRLAERAGAELERRAAALEREAAVLRRRRGA